MRLLRALLIVLATANATPRNALAQGGFPLGEWGDAPNGWAAYWDIGVAGRFPTCLGSSYGFLYHAPAPGGNNCYFGVGFDYEMDGNGGICSEPYDVDECYGPLDGDAGLTMPTAFTYGPTHQLIPCSGQPPTSLGRACTMARWGRDIDILINNNLVPYETVYLNVMFDWDRNGEWAPWPAGPSNCGSLTSEHVIQNMPVPPAFNGFASQLGLADFPIGPFGGVVWVRFSVTLAPLDYPYQPPYIVEYGETEDYLLRIDPPLAPRELGDAPDGVLAYPPSPTMGRFPTCVTTANHVWHEFNSGLSLGTGLDPEFDGNHDNCGFNPYDFDECFADADAGLVTPQAATIAGGGVVAGCAVNVSPLGLACEPIAWGPGLDIAITNTTNDVGYLNVLADWDRSGTWDAYQLECQNGNPIRERVVTNLTVPSGFTGLLSQLNPPAAFAGQPGFSWFRFTLSSLPAPAVWDGSGGMGTGETEDYLLLVSGSLLEAGRSPEARRVSEAWPNPARRFTRVGFSIERDEIVAVTVHDVGGRRIRELLTGRRHAGTHEVEWDGFSANGVRQPAGAYFVHVRIGPDTQVRRVVLLP